MTHDDAPMREDEIPSVAELLGWAFGQEPERSVPWLARAGHANVHLHRRSGRIEATAITIPMGQYFGGKSVRMVGIGGVATSPEARGTGAASALMTRILHEQRASGFALSTLYPATLGLYRKVGYERAGARYEAAVPLSAIRLDDRSLPLRPATPEDVPAIEACYRARASQANGFLDRGPFIWQRVREPRDVLTKGFVVGEGAHVEGYTFVHERRDASLHYALVASDVVATTPRAYARLLTFAADHGTLGTNLVWKAAPSDPSIQLLPRVEGEIRFLDGWMLRILDVPAAMAARGWPEHVTTEVDLEIADDGIASNAGRFTLHVAGGRGEAVRGGKGSVKIDVRGLASLYSSWLDPQALVAIGGVEGPSRDLAALAAAFSGTSPWMPDMF